MSARLDPDRLRRARSYRKFTLWTGVATTIAGVTVMVGLYVAGAGIALRDLFSRALVPYPQYCAAGCAERFAWTYLVVATFALIGWVVQLPFAYALWRRGRAEGIVVQRLGGAFADRIKALVIGLVLLGIPITAWLMILDRPDWPLWTSVGAAAFSVIATLLGPALTSVFFRFEPLADETVAQRVRAVAERAGVRVSGVYRILLGQKTTAANAMVIGIGPTKRIALGDTLLAHFPIEETEAVVAHEVGHDASGDPPRYVVAFTVAGSLALIVTRIAVDAITCGVMSMSPGAPLQPACGAGTVTAVNGASDPAAYPLVAAAFSVIGLIGRPALMAFTRWRESAADAFGARYTSRDAMARALVRLADQNLADPEPPRWEEIWFYSHPAIANRVRALGLRWEDYAATSPLSTH
jgi:STE24 endopeptidase